MMTYLYILCVCLQVPLFAMLWCAPTEHKISLWFSFDLGRQNTDRTTQTSFIVRFTHHKPSTKWACFDHQRRNLSILRVSLKRDEMPKKIRNLHKSPRKQINTRDVIVFLVYFCCINILLEKAWSSFRQVGGATVVTYEQEIYIRSVFQCFGKKKVCGLCLGLYMLNLHTSEGLFGQIKWELVEAFVGSYILQAQLGSWPALIARNSLEKLVRNFA